MSNFIQPYITKHDVSVSDVNDAATQLWSSGTVSLEWQITVFRLANQWMSLSLEVANQYLSDCTVPCGTFGFQELGLLIPVKGTVNAHHNKTFWTISSSQLCGNRLGMAHFLFQHNWAAVNKTRYIKTWSPDLSMTEQRVRPSSPTSVFDLINVLKCTFISVRKCALY